VVCLFALAGGEFGTVKACCVESDALIACNPLGQTP
jgi:hypothetical protein